MFDLQLFGVNDTVTSSYDLKLHYKFDDDDTRTTSLPNPRSNITWSDIADVASELYTTQAFVGDKNNGAFETITSAVYVEETRRYLDLT